MQYFDKNGKEIKAGMKILMEDGSIEMVYMANIASLRNKVKQHHFCKANTLFRL